MGFSPAEGALLLSILGITNTIGRILAGWMSDRPWADCLFINNISLIIGGIATIACPFCDEYYLLVAYSCVFGLAIGKLYIDPPNRSTVIMLNLITFTDE